MFDDVFVLYEVLINIQGELYPLRHVLHNLFLTSEGV
jgi:hypothetical protein